tara:strand:+ start:18875 stop:19555 length:681 start_codon:yes stop_codon:yes gene_type:complete
LYSFINYDERAIIGRNPLPYNMGIEKQKDMLKTHLIDWGLLRNYRTGDDELLNVLSNFDELEIKDTLEELIHLIIIGELTNRYKIRQDDIDLAFDIYESENSATIVYALYLFERNYTWMQLLQLHYNHSTKHDESAMILSDLLDHQVFIASRLLMEQEKVLELIGLFPTAQLADKIQETHIIGEQWNSLNFMSRVHEELAEKDATWGKNPFKESEANARRFNRENE